MEFSGPEYWNCPSPGDLPNPGIEPRSLALQADSLPAELQGKPKNTGVGSLYLLQGIFPIQESNQDLLQQEEKGMTDNEIVDSITDSMDMSLSKLWETVKDKETWRAAVHGVSKCQTRLSD